MGKTEPECVNARQEPGRLVDWGQADMPPDPDTSPRYQRIKKVFRTTGVFLGGLSLGGGGVYLWQHENFDRASERTEAVLVNQGLIPPAARVMAKGKLILMSCKAKNDKGALAALETGPNVSNPVVKLRFFPGVLDYEGQRAFENSREKTFAFTDPLQKEEFYRQAALFCNNNEVIRPDSMTASTSTTIPTVSTTSTVTR